MEKLFALIDGYYNEMVGIRRHLHEYPELSFEEVETPAYIAAFHRELGHEVREGVGGRGVVAILCSGKPGKTVALRADFDALAIQEENDVSYKSKVAGKMHACGHDGHTATLLGLAKALNAMKDEITGNVVFIHQHAEEVAPGGAKPMIEDGCLDGVDVIFGTHLWAPIPLGEILVKDGAIMAAADKVEITVQGKGGHGAEPHHSIDAVTLASQFVVNAQQLVSRRIDPLKSAVLTIGHLEAINPFNVIADRVILAGTIRTFEEEVRSQMEQELEAVLNATCLAFGASYEYRYTRGYPPVYNHQKETEFVAQLASTVPGVEQVITCPPFMIGEDFAYYLEKVPGTFFFTGAKKPEWETAYPHHHARFDFDERAMLIAAKTLGKATLTYLKEH
ncbi:MULTISPECIES: M20 family metallopeptidase [Lysinibacillus]|uniref:Amidohydrolase n=1 Tax=Lysinibacillus fusiformis TaxID=28031 RepID=A0A2I0V641_9BACI|nr:MULTISPECIES: M20 family metallopeptidase [Lysinibacillus]KUF32880.1 peptidase M20 [Lysinibacillus sp. F5]MEE3807669.1 M20 family metallopeptidase [Lysinibacillus fusiformis]PKU53763.1 amidohydrolase [Lysinibacillus fusiformis]SCY49972.1 amidohydrolase [Lysinibacillus sp. SG9]SDB21996.1 amidohydrolase [Lysinibacillus sp. TC-37]